MGDMANSEASYVCGYSKRKNEKEKEERKRVKKARKKISRWEQKTNKIKRHTLL